MHCCAADVPIALLHAAGADAIALDAALLDTAAYDALGEAVDAGVVAVARRAARHRRGRSSLDTGCANAIRRLWSALGFAPAQLAASVVPTPACGLAGASPAYVRRALSLLRDLGQVLLDDAA